MGWLDPILSTEASPLRTLVLCRTGASANAVRRWIAENGGIVGIEVKTPTALARSLEAPHLWNTPASSHEQRPEIPDDHTWASVKQRPGLAAILAGHVNDIRVQGIPHDGLPAEIPPLLDAGWALDADTAALLALEHRIEKEKGKRPLGYDRVFSVGFGDTADGLPQPPGTNAYFDRILAGLNAVALKAPAGDLTQTVDAAAAADVASEAAWVVHHSLHHADAGGRLEDVLVLFSGSEDRDRIAAALARNGVATAIDQTQRLSRHALAVLIRTILSWFDDRPADKVILVGETIRKVFQNPLIGQADYTPAEAERLRTQIAGLTAKLPAGESSEGKNDAVPEERLNLKRRTVTDALLACHLVRGSLADWRASLQAVAVNQDLKTSTKRAALLLGQRLEWLDDVRGPTMGHVRAYLNKLSLLTYRDRVAMLIQKALADGAGLQATEDVLDEILSGAASSGDINRGVTLLAYGQYDGRPSKLCLLTGIHSKGIGLAPPPDPFFTDDIAAAWGHVGGASHVDFLMNQARAAVARADRSFACVVRRAADGRAVVPVSHPLISLRGDGPENDLKNYGLALCNPENRNHEALEVVRQEVPQAGPELFGDTTTDHAALMTTMEWVRSGGNFESTQTQSQVEPDANENGRRETLKDLLNKAWGATPAAIRPYMGDAGSTPTAALARDAVLSVSTAFEPMSHCMFQAYMKTKLRLREAEDLEEELSAKEVGTAVHAAMEELGLDPAWRPATEAEVEKSVTDLSKRLAAATTKHLQDALKDLPKATAALENAREGLARRWENHLKMYVRNRVRSLESLKAEALEKIAKGVVKSQGAAELLASTQGMTGDAQKCAANWLKNATEARLHGHDPLAAELFVAKSEKSKESAREWAGRESVQQALDELVAEVTDAANLTLAREGQICGGATEWKFGDFADDDLTRPLKIELGTEADVMLHGSIDLVRYTRGPDGTVAVHIVDYKTGKPWSGWKDSVLSGTRPQLPVYNIALHEARKQGLAPGDDPVTGAAATLAYDFIRDKESTGIQTWQPGTPGPSLQETADLLGYLVGLARSGEYPVLPHTLTCPVLNRYGDYCPFRAVCRFHTHPGTEGLTDDAGTGTEE